MENKRSKKPSGAQFRKRGKDEKEKRAKDKGMQYAIMSVSGYYACSNETDSNSLM